MARDLSTDPTSPTMIQALKIRTLVASSSVFQAALGVETVKEAEERVYVNYVQDVDAADKPYAIIQMGATTQEAVGGGIQQAFLPNGTVSVTYADKPTTPNPGDSIVDFYNFAEAAWQDVLQCSGFNGLPKIMASTFAVPMLTGEENSPAEEAFWIVVIEAQWNYLG